ncbi:MAG: hypothetical protein QCI82_09035 [Candidatus Thermoplasmatota archaeon]|nr:hypothetical protein [Candidatus Thermoplasmatota archaeon]
MDDHDGENYRKLTGFLDSIESTDPRKLSEPYRTLWFRIMNVDPSGRDLTSSIPDVVITEPEVSRDPSQKRIEVISPSSVGPTVEMKVREEEKITFRAADEKDVSMIKSKEQGAKALIAIQEMIAPLKGMPGEPAQVAEEFREIARLYREGDYEGMNALASSLREKLMGRDFRQSVMIDLQRRIAEYSEIGADMSGARDRFREMAQAFKEERADFIGLAGSCHRLAEDAVRGILGELEEAEVVVGELVEPKPEARRKPVKKPEEPAAPDPKPNIGDTVEKSPEPSVKAPEPVIAAPPSETGSSDVKPVIKVVKKKLVAVNEGPTSEVPVPEEGPRMESPQKDPNMAPEPEPSNVEGPQEDPENVPEPAEAEEPPSTTSPEPKPSVVEGVDPSSEASMEAELNEAYRRISLVYSAASKMHSAGKDVSQLFDLYNFAEQARQKGDNKVYIGVSKQLESMLLSMQTKG